MYLNKYAEVISSCRFCFMCRHLSAVGQVSCRESDTPRGRALIAGTFLRFPEKMRELDYVDAFYRSDLSGANRFHCDGYHDGKGYDEVGMQLAARKDIVDAMCAPPKIKALAEELKQSANWSVTGKGDVLYFIDPVTAQCQSTIDAVKKVLDHARISYSVMQGGCIGKALLVLGFVHDAREVMQKFADAVKESGAKTVIFSSPAAVDAVKNDFKELGVDFPFESYYTAGYFAELAAAKKVSFSGKIKQAVLLPSDYLKNYLKCDCTGKLLELMNIERLPVGTNDEESCSVAEGALVLERINPELNEAMKQHVAAMIDPALTVIAGSTHSARALRSVGCNVKTIEEIAGEFVC